MDDLFDFMRAERFPVERLADGAVVLRGKALGSDDELLHDINEVAAVSPFRKMTTPSGHVMSVAMTNCGEAGWVTDRTGYRYDRLDPETGNRWPAMPNGFMELAASAAYEAGYPDFIPDACLINRYETGSKLSLHQDKDEQDFSNPIVSLSLGLPATFQFGGLKRTDPIRKIQLRHGDVVVWGGPSRLIYHGILPLKGGEHSKVGNGRLNLTFRYAL